MFENLSTVTKVLMAATAAAAVATTVFVVKDVREANGCCCEDEVCECELTDPTAEA